MKKKGVKEKRTLKQKGVEQKKKNLEKKNP